MSTRDLSAARWFTSSRSANNGDCVECAILPAAMAVRDSKDRSGPVLVFSHSQWSVFVTDITTHRQPADLG
ncbi:DUF397 domain-containing protein [Micromonospora craniellae]|uniref:DUF397 domain-containing protein n=1 Tax=Micromonospora craniellae TaxID=2294034 RepID=A0A372FZA2_9ACTN|nr:DUF397 domain-containing protein [Micromonospora craniellae]QOC90986.1 DUF397 domain-containing protein [Micromonospora craniellae]RFS45954.1 DUF397 domain-containing protein [Micromonospora craniellae]